MPLTSPIIDLTLEGSDTSDVEHARADVSAARADLENTGADVSDTRTGVEESRVPMNMESTRADGVEQSTADVETTSADVEQSTADVEAKRAKVDEARTDEQARGGGEAMSGVGAETRDEREERAGEATAGKTTSGGEMAMGAAEYAGAREGERGADGAEKIGKGRRKKGRREGRGEEEGTMTVAGEGQAEALEGGQNENQEDGQERKKKRKKKWKGKGAEGATGDGAAANQLQGDQSEPQEKAQSEPQWKSEAAGEAGGDAGGESVEMRRLLRLPRYFTPAEGQHQCYLCGLVLAGPLPHVCQGVQQGDGGEGGTGGRAGEGEGEGRGVLRVWGVGAFGAAVPREGDVCALWAAGPRGQALPLPHVDPGAGGGWGGREGGAAECMRCGGEGHVFGECWQPYDPADLARVQCHVCLQWGHLACADLADPPPKPSCCCCGARGHHGEVSGSMK
ncbi:unnamed protein product, partial [Closterium sp. NIES-65]